MDNLRFNMVVRSMEGSSVNPPSDVGDIAGIASRISNPNVRTISDMMINSSLDVKDIISGYDMSCVKDVQTRGLLTLTYIVNLYRQHEDVLSSYYSAGEIERYKML